jgi:hypothetical protein
MVLLDGPAAHQSACRAILAGLTRPDLCGWTPLGDEVSVATPTPAQDHTSAAASEEPPLARSAD